MKDVEWIVVSADEFCIVSGIYKPGTGTHNPVHKTANIVSACDDAVYVV